MIEKLLIANRGEIAVRIMRTCRELGIATVAVHSEDDVAAMHVRMADEAVALPGQGASAYLDVDQIVLAVARSGADAVHPGYGFLSERSDFVAAVVASGCVFVGPPADAIRSMGDKVASREIAAAAGVPTVPGTGVVESADEVVAFGDFNGWPVAVKASYGGGGRGMRVVWSSEEATDLLASAQAEALSGFGRDECFVERYLTWPRHVEVQILADQHGSCIWIGDRDCSVQRRHQKVIEEAPAVGLDTEIRQRMGEASIAVAKACGYSNAGTVEMLVQDGEFYFLEMNTRLQVEHPVTELVYGVDLVAEQLHIAGGGTLRIRQEDVQSSGHAIELRINAERPFGGQFIPSPGDITLLKSPDGPGVRWDGGYESGDTVGSNFDNLVGKLIVEAPSRPAAIARARRALDELTIEGIATNVNAHRTLLEHEDFVENRHSTRWLETKVKFGDEPPPDVRDDHEGALSRRAVGPAPRRYEIGEHVYLVPTFDRPGVATASVPNRGAGAVDAADLGRRPGRGAPGNGVVSSPMQGTVLKVLVKPGDVVEASDTVCVLEAMKMENALVAGITGIVAEVHVEAGQSVRAGERLVVVEAPDGDEQ